MGGAEMGVQRARDLKGELVGAGLEASVVYRRSSFSPALPLQFPFFLCSFL